MDTSWSRVRTVLAAAVSAALIGVVGIGAVAPETAQAAGVVVEHRAYGAPAPAATRERDELDEQA